MKTNRVLTTIGGLLAAASLALAQYAPVAPPAPPTPPAAPAPLAQPAPPVPPTPVAAPMPAPRAFGMPDLSDLDLQIPADVHLQMEDARRQIENARIDIEQAFQKNWGDVPEQAFGKALEAQEKAVALAGKDIFQYGLKAPVAFQSRAIGIAGRGDEAAYQAGLRAIDNHQYEQALTEFNATAARAGSRAEGALYWKAYVLKQLGRASEAQAAIDTLRKTYPSSRWLDDAKALELEVKQSKGPVSPEAESDEDLKVLALNGLMQSDPERALPQIEKLLQGSHSPNLKRQALMVIAQSSLPKAQQDLEQIVRGGNPDLQVRAIQYLASKRDPKTPQLLLEVYTATTDPAVKQAILNSFSGSRDKDRLFQVARVEKDGNLRSMAFSRLGEADGQPELWQIYQGETTPEGKISVLNYMARNGNLEKLADVAHNDKDIKVRQKAIQMIATQEAGTPSTTLVSLYSSEQDDKVKQTIIDSVSSSRTCKPLVDLAKAETKNLQLKIRMVQRLSGMTKSCPAANDYMTEILNKI